MKSKGVAFLLWFFLGFFSAHRFYLEKTGSGILYLCTFQLFGIGWIIDLFTLGGMVDNYNLMHGFMGPNRGNVNQNVVVNVAAPVQPAPVQHVPVQAERNTAE
ncbi:TM2 domain-containing protein [Lacinutrix sp. MEBiC02595]